MKQWLLCILLYVCVFPSFCQQNDSIVCVSIIPIEGELSAEDKILETEYLLKSSKYGECATILNLIGGTSIAAAGLFGLIEKDYLSGVIYGSIGGGLLSAGVVFMILEKKNIRKIHELYNGSASAPTNSRIQSELGIGLTGNGVGLTLRF